MDLKERLNLDKFLLKQKAVSVGAKYNILDENGNEILWLKQKMFALGHHVEVYDSETSKTPSMTIKQDRFFQILASYTITDFQGALIGKIKAKFSFFKSTWLIFDQTGNQIGRAEQGAASAMLGATRYGRTARELANFDIYQDDTKVGIFNRRITLFDKYVMDLSADPGKRFDRRLALGLAVILDLGESR